MRSYQYVSLIWALVFIAAFFFSGAARAQIPLALWFAATYVIEITLHFYYLKNYHLNPKRPRVILTLARAVILVVLLAR